MRRHLGLVKKTEKKGSSFYFFSHITLNQPFLLFSFSFHNKQGSFTSVIDIQTSYNETNSGEN